MATYITTSLISFFSAIHKSIFDSFIGEISHDEKEKATIQNILFGKISSGTYTGYLIGFSVAGIVSTNLGFKVAFIIDR